MTVITNLDLVEREMAFYKQWLLGATKPRQQVFPQTSSNGSTARIYSLKGKQNRKYLQHEKQRFGINLGWTNDGSNTTGDKKAQWFFVREGNRTGPIRFGEPIAIGWAGREKPYIRYKKRTWGINLTWSKRPVYEWKLLGGEIGEPVHTQEQIAIFNEKSKGGQGQCMIYFDRSFGVGAHIGWPSSRSWTERLKELPKDVTKAVLKKAAEEAMKKLLGG